VKGRKGEIGESLSSTKGETPLCRRDVRDGEEEADGRGDVVVLKGRSRG
jgi:hypothetical protein